MKHYDINLPAFVSIHNVYGQIQYIIRIDIKQVADVYEWLEIELPRGIWSRSAIISAIIRLRYTADDVEAIVNNVLSDPLDESRMAEYKALQEWRRKAKEWATELMQWADEHGMGGLIPQEEEAYEATDVDGKPDGVLQLAQALSLAKSQAQDLDDEQAAEVPALFPAWADFIGKEVETGKRLFYAGRLWKVLQTHTCQENWTPDITPALFTEVVVQGEGEPELGTLDNPIPYNGNMELEEGKYYSQYDVVYLCIRSTGVPVYNNLADLVNIYVQVA